ncbi:MAG TPA: hypothetical protein VK369_02255 [Segetibacter sp.]|nr:hypothetical protein [Segetibacter sp.]
MKDIIERTREAEAGQEWERAAKLYEQVIKESPVNEYAYDRLMILYRKAKPYKDELRIIKAGIKAYENFYKTKSKRLRSRKVAEISNAFLKSTGLADKEGIPVYDQEPLGKWKKRKALVEKKIKK